MTVSDESRPKGHDEAPAELEEARAARELAEAMDGMAGASPDEEALAAAVQLAAARTPELSSESRDRLGDELFGPAAAATGPRWRGWAIAAGVLVVAGTAVVVGAGGTAFRAAAPSSVEVSTASPEAVQAPQEFHRKAELLIAELMPQPTAAERAQALADRVEARLKQEAAP